MTVRWGIVGLGRMAALLAPEYALAEGAELAAVASRSQDKADAFAVEHGVPRAYGSLQDMLDDDVVDAVHVCSPHPAHLPEALQIAAAGKAMVVEKSMAMDPDEVRAIIDAARAAGVFCMEGMWTRFLPVIVELRRRVREGELGEVRSVQGDLHARRAYDPGDRLFAPELGGGALLDLGVYTTAFAVDLLGAPDSVHAVGSLLPNGVEGTVASVLGWADGRTASLSVGFDSYGPGRYAVMGTEGWIDVLPRFHHPSTIVVHRAGQPDEVVELPTMGAGYHHEITAASRAIAAEELESSTMPLAESLAVAEVLAECRRQVLAGPH